MSLRRLHRQEAALTGVIIDWAKQYRRYGYRRVTALLRAEGWWVQPQAGEADLGA